MDNNKNNALQCKKDLKWFHSRIEIFNADAQYQIDSLTSSRRKIRELYRLENFNAIRQERVIVERHIRNLKQLLNDIGELRKQVVDKDLDKFDKLVSHSRDRISSALNSFKQYYQSLSLVPINGRSSCTPSRIESVGTELENEEYQKQIIVKIDEERWNSEILAQRAQEMEKLEENCRAVNEMLRDVFQIIHEQAPAVERIEDVVEESHEHVVTAQKELAQVAAKINGSAYPLLGAVLGVAIGGPLGFLAGLKIGTLIGLTGSVIGFSGGKVLKMKVQNRTKKAAML